MKLTKTKSDQIGEILNIWNKRLSLWESIIDFEIKNKNHKQANDWQNRCEVLKNCIAEIQTILK